MNIKTKSNTLRKIKPSSWIIILYILLIPVINTNHHNWADNEGVIKWDIKSYYAYLPAAFIYHDISLNFINENPQKFNKWIWPINTPTRKKGIITSMGLSVLYAPFFAIAHTVALLNPQYQADGYSLPYHYALAFSTFFYFILGLFVLRKILRQFYPEKIVAITLFFVGFGTNLLYYVTYEAAMSHGYNFVLIVLFLYFLIKWHKSHTVKHTVILGLLGGIISLIRPTNILILILIPLWEVYNLKSFKESIIDLLSKWKLILLMFFSFILVWIPQFIYWKYISGQFLYFSYGETGGKFFFLNPQLSDFLFSYKKGWYVYTPLMLFATIGIYFLYQQKKKYAVAIAFLLIIYVYILSSWWSWWFGGAFGQRSMVDLYGILALPFAAIMFSLLKRKWIYKISVSLVVLFVFFNLFQTRQYKNGAIHYWWMTKEAYWETFLKINPTCKYLKIHLIPDYEKARQGIYIAIPEHDKNSEITDSMLVERIIKDYKKNYLLIDSLKSISLKTDSILKNYAFELIKNKKAENYFNQLKIDYYMQYIDKCYDWRLEVEKMAKKKNVSYNEMLLIEAKRVFKTYSEKYD
ncbi:MAG: hypothetical protein JXR51_07400 [Bacteroidales bacterium]|nr:hypothetical protein [Bacteroidales bacterium]MBN2756988.1 hypothetical protein [Bacteroidales bacterium]